MLDDSVIAGFWAKVPAASERGDGCWEWTGRRKNGHGGPYGLIQIGASDCLAHRVSWEIHNGKVPDRVIVCHACDNPPCVRPDHLFLGTHRDNARDKQTKDRAGKKLTWLKVDAIRAKRAEGALWRELQNEYGVSKVTIRKILSGRTWNQTFHP